MEKCPNCGNPLPRGKQVHDECIDEFIAYLENTQEQFRINVERETQKSIMLIKHHGNNVLAVVEDNEMSIEQKVQALVGIQKKMIENLKEYFAMTGVDWMVPRTDSVYAMFEGLKDPLSPVSQIRALYERTYPEYC